MLVVTFRSVTRCRLCRTFAHLGVVVPSRREVQIDQFYNKNVRLIGIVHSAAFCVRCATTFSGEWRRSTVTHLAKYLHTFGLQEVDVVSGGEPLVVAIANELAKAIGNNSTSEVAVPGRHAPKAERAIRTIKNGAKAAELHAKAVGGVVLLDSDEGIRASRSSVVRNVRRLNKAPRAAQKP